MEHVPGTRMFIQLMTLSSLLLVIATLAHATAPPNGTITNCYVPMVLTPSELVVTPGENLILNLVMNNSEARTNYTDIELSAETENERTARVTSDPEVTSSDGDVTTATIVISGGPAFGLSELTVSQTLHCVGGVELTTTLTVDVRVVRRTHRAVVHVVLEYICMALGMILLLFLGCQSTVYDIRRSWAWILCTLLLQIIVLPLFFLAFVNLFHLDVYKKLGVMATSYSPVGVAVTGLATLMDADLELTSSLIILNYLLANAFMPLWSLQLDNISDDLVHGSDTPFAAINITLTVALALYVTGLLINMCIPEVAEEMMKATKYIAVVVLTFAILGSLAGGSDMLTSLGYKEVLLMVMWPLLFIGIATCVLCCCRQTGARFRASALFLLVKSCHIPQILLSSALDTPEADVARVSSYFMYLMTLVIGATFTLVYKCYACYEDPEGAMIAAQKDRNQEMKLVIELDADRHVLPPAYDSLDFAERKPEEGTSGAMMFGMSTAAMIVPSFGGPDVAL